MDEAAWHAHNVDQCMQQMTALGNPPFWSDQDGVSFSFYHHEAAHHRDFLKYKFAPEFTFWQQGVGL
jgi:uncharacterized membrane protein